MAALKKASTTSSTYLKSRFWFPSPITWFRSPRLPAVSADGVHRMGLGGRKPNGPAVNLPRAGVEDSNRVIALATGFQNRELAAAVDLQIGLRILHAIDVASLTRQVEEKILVLQEVLHPVHVANVGDIDPELGLQALDVVAISPG